MRGATQICPDCGSPLRPCRCDRADAEGYASPPGAVANSTLGTRKPLTGKKRLRSRTLSEKYGDDPLRYGPLFKAVRRLRCGGRVWARGHRCGPGVAPASAHHLDRKGHVDAAGLIPACAGFHDDLHERFSKVEASLPNGWTIEKLGKHYVGKVARGLDQNGKLPDEVRAELLKRGVSW